MIEEIFSWTVLLGLVRTYWWFCLIILATPAWLIYCWRYVRNECRYGMNLRRRIYFLKTSDSKNLQTQKDKLKNVKLFRIEQDIKDISGSLDVLQNLESNSVYIVGYSSSYPYKNLFNVAQSKNIPIIIFAKQGEIKSPEIWELINGYIYCDVANTTNRLSVILLNMLKIL